MEPKPKTDAKAEPKTEAKTEAKKIQLPTLVATPVDVGRLIRELDALEDVFLEYRVRQGGKAVSLPKTSQLLDKTIDQNQLNILQAADRQALHRFLVAVRKYAPVLHFSFGADPPVSFIEKLTTWLRSEIHPQLLLTIGLQPSIAAGCMVRSTNRSFDLTLRHHFDNQREILVQSLLQAATGEPLATTEPAAAAAAPSPKEPPQ